MTLELTRDELTIILEALDIARDELVKRSKVAFLAKELSSGRGLMAALQADSVDDSIQASDIKWIEYKIEQAGQ